MAANSRVTVVYDPADSSMKACVAGSWLALSGGGGGGGPLDGLTDVTISSPALNHVLLYNGGAWVNAPVTVSESDPQVGTLTANKWCAANAGATAIDCTQDAPSGGASQWTDGTSGAIYYNGGNVGIGTSSPAVKLHVEGGAVSIGQSTDSSDKLYIWNSGAHQMGLRKQTGSGVRVFSTASGSNSIFEFAERLSSGDPNTDTIRFMINGDGEVGLGGTITANTLSGAGMVVKSSGNVGIGTTNPTTKFAVSPSSTSPQFRIYSDCGGLSYTAVSLVSGTADCATYNLLSDGNHLFINRPTGNIYFRSSNVDQMILASTGLSVIGGVSATGNIIADASASIGNGASAFSIFTLNSKTASGVAQNPYIQWFRDSTRQAYMGWGTPGTIFRLDMENGNQLFITNPWGAVFSSDDVRKPSGGVFVASSDARLKDIGDPYTTGLDALMNLKPVNYRYKKDNPRGEPSDKSFVGLIAQDVQKVFPRAVREDRDGYLSLDSSEFTYALINAVKELKAANDQLRSEFEAYKAAHP